MEQMDSKKIYVKVTADFTPDGFLQPTSIEWEDGRKFKVDRVMDCRRAASLKAGGVGMRYTCMIGGRRHYLFYEDNFRWFVEAK